MSQMALDLDRIFRWKMGKRFGTWNLKTVATELSKYKLDLVGVQDVRCDRNGTEPVGKYMFCYGKGNENYELGTGFYVHKRIVSAVKRVAFVSAASTLFSLLMLLKTVLQGIGTCVK
jgi:hypothetical protein